MRSTRVGIEEGNSPKLTRAGEPGDRLEKHSKHKSKPARFAKTAKHAAPGRAKSVLVAEE